MKEIYDKQITDVSDEYKKMQGYTFHKRVFGYLDSQLGESKDMPDLLKHSAHAQIVLDTYFFIIIKSTLCIPVA